MPAGRCRHRDRTGRTGTQRGTGVDKQIRQFDVEGVANSGEQLARCLFLPAFHLGQVAEGDSGGRGDFPQGSTLLGSRLTQADA